MPTHQLTLNSDLYAAADLGLLIGQFSSNNRISNIIPYTVNQLGVASNMRMSVWVGQAGGTFFNYGIQTSNQTRGTVSVSYPWTQTSTTSGVNIGITRQSFDNYIGNIDVVANAIYPWNFNYWYDPVNAIFFNTAAVSLSIADITVWNSGYLIAYWK